MTTELPQRIINGELFTQYDFKSDFSIMPNDKLNIIINELGRVYYTKPSFIGRGDTPNIYYAITETEQVIKFTITDEIESIVPVDPDGNPTRYIVTKEQKQEWVVQEPSHSLQVHENSCSRSAKAKAVSFIINLILNICLSFMAIVVAKATGEDALSGKLHDLSTLVAFCIMFYLLALAAYYFTGSFAFLLTVIVGIIIYFNVNTLYHDVSDTFQWAQKQYNSRSMSVVKLGSYNHSFELAKKLYNWVVILNILNIMSIALIAPLRKRFNKPKANSSGGVISERGSEV